MYSLLIINSSFISYAKYDNIQIVLKYAITIFSTSQIESRGESNILQNDGIKRYAYAILYCNLFIALQFIKKHSIIEMFIQVSK